MADSPDPFAVAESPDPFAVAESPDPFATESPDPFATVQATVVPRPRRTDGDATPPPVPQPVMPQHVPEGDDEHFGGTPKEKPVPKAFLRRFFDGDRLNQLNDVIEKGFKHGFGDAPVGFDPNSDLTKTLQGWGLFSSLGNQSAIRTLNDAMIKPVATLVDGALRLPGGLIGALAAGIGQASENTGLVKEGGGERLASEIEIMGQMALLKGGDFDAMSAMDMAKLELKARSGKFTRPAQTADGTPHDQQIGTLPTPKDFDNSARVVGGDAAPDHVYDKLDKLWEEHGIHPAEVAHDAQADSTIRESLLTPGGSLPEAYTGVPEALPDVRRVARGTSPEARAIWRETDPSIIDDVEKAVLEKQGAPITNSEIVEKVGAELDDKTVDAIKEGLGVPSDPAEHIKWRIRVGGDGTRDLYDELGINSSSANRAHAGKNAIYTPATAMEINNAQETHTPGWSTFIMTGKGGDRVVRVLRDSNGRQIHHTVFSLDENGKAMPDSSHLYTDIDHTGNGYTEQAVKALDREGYGATDAIKKTTSGTNEMSRAAMDKIVTNARTEARIVKDELTGHDVDLNKTEAAMQEHVDNPKNVGKEADMRDHFNRTNPVNSLKPLKEAGMDITPYIPKEDELYTPSGPLIPDGYKAVVDPASGKMKVRAIHEGEKAYYEPNEVNPHDALDPRNLDNPEGYKAAVAAKDTAEIDALNKQSLHLKEADAHVDIDYNAKLADLEKRIADEKAAPEGLGSKAHRDKVKADLDAERTKMIVERQTQKEAHSEQQVEIQKKIGETKRRIKERDAPARAEPTEAERAAAQKEVLSKISVDEPTPKEPVTSDVIYTNFMDSLYPVSKTVKEAGKKDLSAISNPAKLVRLLQGASGRAMHFLHKATFDFKTYKNNGKSLFDIIKPHKGDLDGLRAYLTARRAIDLDKRLQTATARLEAAKAEVTKVASSNEVNQAKLAKAMAEYDRTNKIVEQHNRSGVDLESAKTVVAAGKQYEKTMSEIIAYQNRVSQYLRDSGMLSEENYRAIQQANWDFVPLHRVVEAGKTPKPLTRMERLRGEAARDTHVDAADDKIVDPLESIIKNTQTMMEMADRNEVKLSMIDLLKDTEGAEKLPAPENAKMKGKVADALHKSGVEPDEALVDALTPSPTNVEDGTLTAFRDGKQESYRVDKELARALSGQDRETIHWIIRVVAIPAKGLKMGSTATFDFMARHLMRDAQYTFLTSKTHSQVLMMGEGILGQLLHDDAYWQWMKGGGSNVSMYAKSREALASHLKGLTEDHGLVYRAWNVVNPRHFLGYLGHATEIAENASHVGVFKSALRDELGAAADREAAPHFSVDNIPLTDANKEEILNAAFESRNTGVDAARMGAKMRGYNLISAFANITLQDTDRVIRAFKDRPKITTIKVTAGIVLPSVLLWYANHDDERYKELPQWEKDAYWIAPIDYWKDRGPAKSGPQRPDMRIVDGRLQQNVGPIIRLPKPFGTGVVMGGGVQRALEAFFGDDKHPFSGFFDSLKDTTVPSLIPTMASPMLDQWGNTSTFSKKQLIPGNLEKLLPELQSTPYTSELAKALSRGIASFDAVRNASVEDNSITGATARALTSPMLLENYLRGWTGAAGDKLLRYSDLALRKVHLLPDPPRPPSTMADWEFVKSFIARHPSSSARSIQEFDDTYKANKVYYDSWTAMAKAGDITTAHRIQDMGGNRLFEQLDSIKQTLGIQQQLIANVIKNPKTPDDEKQQLIDGYYYMMISTAKRGNAMMEDAEKRDHLATLKYAREHPRPEYETVVPGL